jgi:hypothetical protein
LVVAIATGGSSFAMPPEPPTLATRAYLDGSILVLGDDLPLPPVCAKCGSSEGLSRRKRTLVHVKEWMLGLLFVCWPGGLMAIAGADRLKIDVPLCAECSRRWTLARLFTFLSVVCLLVSLGWGFFVDSSDVTYFLGGAGLAGAVLVIVGTYLYRTKHTLQFKGFTDKGRRLAGVHPRAIGMAVSANV